MPAIVWDDGGREWYSYGKLHRDLDRPAIRKPCVITGSEHKWWYDNGKLHRDNDLPAIEWANGDKEWFIGGKRMRINNDVVMTMNGVNYALDSAGNLVACVT
jgi:hypothetical protein